MNEQSMRFRIGVFVLAAMILLAVLITLFSGVPNLFVQHNRYVIDFPVAPGVAPGTPVRRSGVRIGEVKLVELNDETGRVRVTVLIEKRLTLRKSEQATLTHGLFGDTAIDFLARPVNGQPPDHSPIDPNEELAGTVHADTSTLLNQASAIVPNTQDTLLEVGRAAKSYERMTPQIESAIKEYQALARSTRETIPELRKTNEEIRELAKASRAIPPELRKTADEVKDLAKAAREAVPEIRRTNDEIQVTARNWGKVGERVDVLLQTNQEKLIKAVESFTETVNRIGQTFSDDNQKQLTAMLRNVRAASDNLDSVTKSTDELLKESRLTMKKVNESITQADAVLANLQQATKPMAERSASVVKNLDESTDKLNRILTDLRDLVKVFGQSEGTVQKLISDPALYNNLSDATCMLARLMPRIDRVLRDMEVFADKIARHPEAIGLGGVVRPGSGLKDAQGTPGSWPRPH